MSPSVFSHITSHKSSYIKRGSIVNLSCEAISGDLPISYFWTNPKGKPMALGDTDGKVSFTLVYYGTYTCTATNHFGLDVSNMELIEPGNT